MTNCSVQSVEYLPCTWDVWDASMTENIKRGGKVSRALWKRQRTNTNAHRQQAHVQQYHLQFKHQCEHEGRSYRSQQQQHQRVTADDDHAHTFRSPMQSSAQHACTLSHMWCVDDVDEGRRGLSLFDIRATKQYERNKFFVASTALLLMGSARASSA